MFTFNFSLMEQLSNVPMGVKRLKAKEQELLGWTAKKELSKINYRIHTDAIKSHLIPEEITSAQASIS